MFRSILFLEPVHPSDVQPDCFADLHLDQVVAALTADREEYALEPLLWTPLASADAVAYRHEAFRELEAEPVSTAVRAFADGMREVRRRRAQADKLRYERQRQRWLLDAIAAYCDAVERLASELQGLDLVSRAFRGLRGHLLAYAGSPGFAALRDEAGEVTRRLGEIAYAMLIHGDRITVRRSAEEADYSREVLETFERFRQGAVQDHRTDLRDPVEMNPVEAEVLARVARLHPEAFAALEGFCAAHADDLDETLVRFDREVQLYLAFGEHIRRLDLPFCLPEVGEDAKEVRVAGTFDLALAHRLRDEGTPIVRNDLRLDDPERIFVVSGPNQGGKTTFARTFGQLHHLAALGLPVPGAEARLFLCDAIHTHFEQEEDIGDLSGKLESDLKRIHAILERATPRSVVVMNESFSSTTLHDALFLGTEILERIDELDALCVYVTFVDELASLTDTTVSVVSAIVPEDPARRTFRIERRPADGLAYAAVLAERHGLTYDALTRRVAA